VAAGEPVARVVVRVSVVRLVTAVVRVVTVVEPVAVVRA
jgi:hypothetical protein